MLDYYLQFFMPRVLEAQASANLAGRYAFGHDFYPVWLISHDCSSRGCDPYGFEMTRKIQQGLFGRTLDSRIPGDPPADYRTFTYPAFTTLLLWPVAEFPLTVVRVAVLFVLVALTVASIFVWMRALSLRSAPACLAAIALLVLCSYPVLEGLYAGQLGLLVGFLLAMSLLALQRGRLFVAGILMSLTMIKPQMTLLVAVCLLMWSSYDWRRRGRFFVGLLAALLALTGAAMLVWPHWIES
jgi:hypothetical protein